ncbi:hypothetical protein Psta_1324 [Pirellula staleyi DSM 6068]|uniref:Uncharacterized protein n=1 Tax=Pirellula staleyi (strain ATCC 27377 / DSM 6068 / ICPB 4128) TaxID=530564 RepID=D2QWC6_PIRSD|nr:hypothetical protein Psta_1324 [Pirellula staleyi DSM 6068]
MHRKDRARSDLRPACHVVEKGDLRPIDWESAHGSCRRKLARNGSKAVTPEHSPQDKLSSLRLRAQGVKQPSAREPALSGASLARLSPLLTM